MPYCMSSNVVYRFLCGRCSATYYGKTCRHLSVRVGEHSDVLPLTGKKSKSKKSAAAKDHMLFWDHILSIDDLKILATSDSKSFDITWWTHLKQKWNVTTSLPIWLIPPMRNYILINIYYCYSCSINI